MAALAFFTGLRLSRFAYSPIFEGVEETTYANLKGNFECTLKQDIKFDLCSSANLFLCNSFITADAALSVAIGGAAGCFLGTDVSYGAANWMGSAIGMQETFSPVLSSAVAGT